MGHSQWEGSESDTAGLAPALAQASASSLSLLSHLENTTIRSSVVALTCTMIKVQGGACPETAAARAARSCPHLLPSLPPLLRGRAAGEASLEYVCPLPSPGRFAI